MNLEHGILLMFIGMALTVVVLFIAYYFGSKDNKKEELTEVEKSLRDTNSYANNFLTDLYLNYPFISEVEFNKRHKKALKKLTHHTKKRTKN